MEYSIFSEIDASISRIKKGVSNSYSSFRGSISEYIAFFAVFPVLYREISTQIDSPIMIQALDFLLLSTNYFMKKKQFMRLPISKILTQAALQGHS